MQETAATKPAYPLARTGKTNAEEVMALTEVKCKVESCYYWGTGDVCKADTIVVDNNTMSRTGMEAGNLDVGNAGKERGRRGFEAGELNIGATGGRQTTGTNLGKNEILAKTSHETLCSTFRPKGTEAKH